MVPGRSLVPGCHHNSRWPAGLPHQPAPHLPSFHPFCFFPQHMTHSALLSLHFLHHIFAHHDGTHLPNTTKCLEGLWISSHQPGPWSPRLACEWLEPVSVSGEQKILIFLYSNLPISSFMDHAFSIIFKKLFSNSVSQCCMTKRFLGTGLPTYRGHTDQESKDSTKVQGG